MKTKVLYVLPAFTFGGTVFSTLNMIMMLDKDKYDISVLPMSHQGPVKEYYKDITILPEQLMVAALIGRMDRENSFIRKVAFFLIKAMVRLSRMFHCDMTDWLYDRAARRVQSKFRFDVVASCQEGASTYFVRHFKNVRRIAWFRSEYQIYRDQLTITQQHYEQRIYKDFDNIVCVSKITRDDFASFFPDIADRLIDIHNIQNVDNIIKNSKETIPDAFSKDIFNIVSVGRFAPQKRFPSIPRLANELRDKGAKFIWYIIGDGNVFGEGDNLQKEIQKYDVSEVVKLIGSRLNPYPYIASADLLVNTSSYEACPRVVIESKILKTPVICADFSSAKEFVTNDYDGYIDTIENLSTPIANMILKPEVYSRIKVACDKYQIDNDLIQEKLISILQPL